MVMDLSVGVVLKYMRRRRRPPFRVRVGPRGVCVCKVTYLYPKQPSQGRGETKEDKISLLLHVILPALGGEAN